MLGLHPFLFKSYIFYFLNPLSPWAGGPPTKKGKRESKIGKINLGILEFRKYLWFMILCKQYIISLNVSVNDSPLTTLMKIQEAISCP